MVLAPGDAGRLPGRGRRRCGSPPGATRSGCWAPSAGPGSRSWAPTPASSRCSGWPRPTWTRYLSGERWYHRKAGADAPRAIAYFSPEYGITAVLPQYSGGLGILAGDHLKAASDLGVPLVGVGLMYQHGYFKQSLSREGWQQETYPVLDPDELPLSLLHEPDGSRAIVTITMPGGAELSARIWVASVGRVPLLLLDSDIEENPDHFREVTDRLYGGNSEHRLRQELLLGVGGVRALRAYSRITGAPDPEVFHTNEGHAGFLGLERIRELTVAGNGPGLDFDTALEVSPRLDRVHHPHPGPGRHRPVPARARRAVLRRRQRRPPAYPSTGSSPSVARTTTAATPASSTWR